MRTHSQSLNGPFALFSLAGMRKGNGRQRFGRSFQETRPASRKRNTQFKNSSTPCVPLKCHVPCGESESLSSQHQDSMSPCESEATQAERPGLVFDSPHGSARFRSGIPRTTPCSSTGTVLSAFCAALVGSIDPISVEGNKTLSLGVQKGPSRGAQNALRTVPVLLQGLVRGMPDRNRAEPWGESKTRPGRSAWVASLSQGLIES